MATLTVTTTGRSYLADVDVASASAEAAGIGDGPKVSALLRAAFGLFDTDRLADYRLTAIIDRGPDGSRLSISTDAKLPPLPPPPPAALPPQELSRNLQSQADDAEAAAREAEAAAAALTLRDEADAAASSADTQADSVSGAAGALDPSQGAPVDRDAVAARNRELARQGS